MYPDSVLFGLTLYELMIVLGFFAAVLTYRIHADRREYPAALQNITMLGGTFGIAIGYYAAVLVQAFYNYLESGIFDLSSDTGATFFGGLMGGVLVFFLVLFLGGAIVYRGKKNLLLAEMKNNCNIAITSVVSAHAFGRLGCLFAGCCHGAVVEGFPGIYNYAVGAYTIPIPLYEALYLFALYAIMTILHLRGKGNQLSVYLFGYGIWRFVIEYFRADERGETIVSFLSPSQLVALLMLAIAVAVFLIQNRSIFGKNNKIPKNSTEKTCGVGENDVENGENDRTESGNTEETK